jgi:hypothetical protein
VWASATVAIFATPSLTRTAAFNVRINGGTHLPDSDHSLYTVKDGIVVVKKGAIFPDGFVI